MDVEEYDGPEDPCAWFGVAGHVGSNLSDPDRKPGAPVRCGLCGRPTPRQPVGDE